MAEFETKVEKSKELSGTLRLSAGAVPALSEGSYKITAGQHSLSADGTPIVGTFSETVRRITVEAESVCIAPNQIYSVYPPSNSSGQYQETLPHIILNRRTLPWERQPSPWVALLVFSEDEQIVLSDGKYRELKTSADAYVPFPRGSAPDGETECRVIDIPVDLFADVLPVEEDLPYLAHIRDVSLDCKVTDRNVTNGGFACIISNRYPKAPEPGMPNVEHTAVLVSLDGFKEFLGKDAASRIKAVDMPFVRMFVLGQWNFFCESRDYGFAKVARALDVDVPRCPGAATLKDPLKKLMEKGYYPMNHTFREGSVGVSFYRPPLLPCKPVSENNEFGRYSDALLRFDPELGMYDATQSAAWQLGRLLSLQDQTLAKDILAWRIIGKRNAAENQNAALLRTVVEPFVPKEKKDETTEVRRRSGETLEGTEWRVMIPDLESTVGITKPVDLEGSLIEAKVAQKLIANQTDAISRILKEKSNQRSAQLNLLKMLNTK